MKWSTPCTVGCIALAGRAIAQTVEVANGTIQGGRCSRTDSSYYFSIPYAEPPIGNQRFAPPQPYLNSYDGIRDSTKPAPACIQFNTLFAESGNTSEDCLYLDVWAPSSATPDSKLPVKVWIYGGSNAAGGISDPTYDGCYSSTDSIVVSINYRVGPLGFLALSGLGLSGNYGIMDQLLGLHWIQENIAAFGGDPSKVLLFGQSAGALDTFVLASLPEAPELMNAAAMESGGGRDLPSLKRVQTWQSTFTKALNCSSKDISCVRSASPAALIAASNAMPAEPAPGAYTPFNNEGARSQWVPVVDGKVIKDSPITSGVKVPAIFGSNTDEGTLFVYGAYGAAAASLNQSVYDEFLNYNFGPLASKVNDTFSVDKFNGSYFAAIQTVLSDVSYMCPAYRGLLKAQENGIPAWSYEFAHAPSCDWYAAIPSVIVPYIGASHTAEIPFVFNTTHNLALPNGTCNFSDSEQALAGTMSRAWTNMAEFAAPADETAWPRWSYQTWAGVNIGDAVVASTVDYSRCLFWDQIYEASVKIVDGCA